jgi:hypothetical protein
MARTFLYGIAGLTVLFLAALFALRLAGDSLSEIALVPSGEFVTQPPLAENAYADPAMWLAHPRLPPDSDPARWQPPGLRWRGSELPVAVFFIHPTSYLERARWNAPLDDAQSQTRARTFLRGMASPFVAAHEIWAPRYRQATFGAFLTDKPQAEQAIALAYRDVSLAFDQFLLTIGEDSPIVLAGHSQGTVHLLRLLRERGPDLRERIAMVYAIGWPISLEHDLPTLALPACQTAEEAGCVIGWSSFAEPAEPGEWLEHYRASTGFDGQLRGDGPILCVNPITGVARGQATAAANLGTLRPSDDLSTGELIPGAVPARCSDRGLLLIGEPPEMGPYVLPGNNYHVYDIPLFWANLRQDFGRRVGGWLTAR